MKFIFTKEELQMIIDALENRKDVLEFGPDHIEEYDKLLTYLEAKLKEMNQEKK